MWSASERYIGTLASLRSPRDGKVTQGALTKHNRGVAERCEMAVQPEYDTMDKSDIEDRAARLANRTGAAVGALAGDAKTEAERLASHATAAAEHAYGQARDQVRGAAATVATSVEQQPLVTLLAVGFICAAVGFLLGRR